MVITATAKARGESTTTSLLRAPLLRPRWLLYPIVYPIVARGLAIAATRHPAGAAPDDGGRAGGEVLAFALRIVSRP